MTTTGALERMSRAQWVRFCAAEQGEDAHAAAALYTEAIRQRGVGVCVPRLDGCVTRTRMPRVSEDGDDEATRSHDDDGPGLTPLEFHTLMLSTSNRAVCRVRAAELAGPLTFPIEEYYCASSHNSYLIDEDQLAGRSSADMYRRILLLGCRSVELDCWDGDNGEPDVKHGFTLCTKVPFDECVQAIAECAFATCDLPVILSLEMHCSVPQQSQIAESLCRHLGDQLVRDRAMHLETQNHR